jgi:lipopolysaccharide/colanic/teichoic acid biosynthesis glycosyltransferase
MFVILTYALGGFDVLSLTRHYASHAPLAALITISIAYVVVVIVQAKRSVPDVHRTAAAAVALVGYVGLGILHTLLRNLFVSSVQKVELVFPKKMQRLADTTIHYVAMSGYPATVSVSTSEAGAGVPIAKIRRAEEDSVYGSSHHAAVFNPLRFFDIALRLLPPELAATHHELLSPQMIANPAYLVVKRAVDVVLATLLIVVTIPLWVAASIGIALSDGRPVFFLQDRIGFNGKVIRIVKFRSLVQASSPSPTKTDDVVVRAFPFGTLLRRLRIDELPQLLLVLLGKMSFVGPRPEMPYFHERSKRMIPCYEQRLNAKPGLTGWAQIRFHHTTSEDEYRDKTAYDLWYVTHRGIWLDAKILIRTIGTLANLFGSR